MVKSHAFPVKLPGFPPSLLQAAGAIVTLAILLSCFTSPPGKVRFFFPKMEVLMGKPQENHRKMMENGGLPGLVN